MRGGSVLHEEHRQELGEQDTPVRERVVRRTMQELPRQKGVSGHIKPGEKIHNMSDNPGTEMISALVYHQFNQKGQKRYYEDKQANIESPLCLNKKSPALMAQLD